MGRRLTCTIPLPTASTPLRTTLLIIRFFAALFVGIGLILYSELLGQVVSEEDGPFYISRPSLPVAGAAASLSWNLIAFSTFRFLSLFWHAAGDLVCSLALIILGTIGFVQDQLNYQTFPRYAPFNGTGYNQTVYNTTSITWENGVAVSNYTNSYTEPSGYYWGFDAWSWMSKEKIAASILLVSIIFQLILIYLNMRARKQKRAPESTEPQETYASRWAKRFPKKPSESPSKWSTIFTRKPSTYPSKGDVELEEMGHGTDESVADEQTSASRSLENHTTRLEPLIEPKYPTRLVNEEEMKFRGMDLDALKSRS